MKNKQVKSHRDKILDAAFKLFNEKGTAEVSTNHICEALDISPGNLYYHFKNKDEIIIAIFENMIAQWNQVPPPVEVSLKSLTAQFEQVFEFLWQYRFIHREIPVLYHRIERFREIFKSIQKKRLVEIRGMIDLYAKASVLHFKKPEEPVNLARSIWFFFLYWLIYLETEGNKISKNKLTQSITIVNTLIKPYMRDKTNQGNSGKVDHRS